MIPYDFPGEDNGYILIGRLVDLHDPRVREAQTPISYLSHGSLRECFCKKCERIFFTSNYTLNKRIVKSCGCSRLKALRKAYKNKRDVLRMRNLMREYKIARLNGDFLEEKRLYDIIIANRQYKAE